jgi:hypothetical protein
VKTSGLPRSLVRRTWSRDLSEAAQVGASGVWGSGPKDVWAVGVEKTGEAASVLHWDGASWSRDTSAVLVRPIRLRAVWRIAGQALDATQPLVTAMDDAGFHFKDAIVLGLCYLIIMACFFVMAGQICLAVIEYYLVVTLATCLIPFGVSSHTKFIAEKAIGAAVAVSVKLMVLSFVVALIQPVLSHIRFSGGGDIKMNELMAMILVSGLLACVVWRATAPPSLEIV